MEKESVLLVVIAQEYKDYLVEYLKQSEHTGVTCRSTINVFAAYLRTKLEREPVAADVDTANLRGYFREVVAKQAPATFDAKRSTLKTVCAWLMSEGYVPYGPNPIDRVEKPTRDRSLPPRRQITEAEFVELLKECKRRGRLRDYYAFLYARLSGRRRQEAAAVRWGDIDWEEQDITWDNTKARRYGIKMPLSPQLRAILEAWKEVYEKEQGCPVKTSWYIFPAYTPLDMARRGRRRKMGLVPYAPMSNPSDILHDYLVTLGIYERGMGWHALRRAMINGVRQAARRSGRADSMDLAQAAANHTSSDTTRVYISADEEYETYKDYMMEACPLSDLVINAVPELAAVRRPSPPGESTLAPAVAAVGGADVIDFTARRRARA